MANDPVNSGNTLREQLLDYSKDRIKRDPKYRKDFIKSRKQKQERRKAAHVQAQQDPTPNNG
jgi:hypothetical protein